MRNRIQKEQQSIKSIIKHKNITCIAAPIQNVKKWENKIILAQAPTNKSKYNKYQVQKLSYWTQLKRMKKQQPKQEPLCLTPDKHTLANYYFCFTCAANKFLTSKILFCRKCYKTKYERHENHKELYSFQSSYFKNKVDYFKHYLSLNAEKLVDNTNPYIRKFLVGEEVDFKQITFIQWLISVQFWKFDDGRTQSQAQQLLMKILEIHVEWAECGEKRESEQLIEWGKVSEQSGQQLIKKMLEQAQVQRKQLQEQKKIIEIILQIESHLHIKCGQGKQSDKQKMAIIQRLDKIIEQFPNNVLLLFIRLSLFDLHKDSSSQWKPILQNILKLRPNLKDSPIVLYIESHQSWRKISAEEFQTVQGVKFVDGNSGNFYVLEDPKAYLTCINKALLVDKNNKVLQAAKGLGLIAQGSYSQAKKSMLSASESESTKMSEYYSRVRLDEKDGKWIQQIMEGLESKSKNYILNTIKILKKLGLSEQIIKCCSILKGQQNQTTFSNVQLIKALLKHNDIQNAEHIYKETSQKISKELKERIDRKIKYCQARIQAQQKNNSTAQKICKQIVIQKPTGSSFYSLASIMYNQQKYQEAEQQINKALRYKESNKYYKLKLYIMLMKKDLQEAKKVMEHLPNDSIDPKIVEMLNQFGGK